MAHDNRRTSALAIEFFRDEQVACHVHLILVLEIDLLYGHVVAGIEVICAVGHIGSYG
ncbi:hypothetical protein D3C80_1992600 [compost metagenome]